MTTDEIIRKAIEELQGQVAIGDVVGHPSHRITHYLIAIEDGMGICQLPGGDINRFPLAELFDANAVRARAVKIRILERMALIYDEPDSIERRAARAKEN